jgi:hypothetical protein
MPLSYLLHLPPTKDVTRPLHVFLLQKQISNLGVFVRGVLLPMSRYVANMTESYTKPDCLLGYTKSLSESC